jgi:hypothetical protein
LRLQLKVEKSSRGDWKKTRRYLARRANDSWKKFPVEHIRFVFIKSWLKRDSDNARGHGTHQSVPVWGGMRRLKNGGPLWGDGGGSPVDQPKVSFRYVLSHHNYRERTNYHEANSCEKSSKDDFQRCQMRLVDQILEEMNTTTAGSPDLGPIKQVWCTNGSVLSDRKMSLRQVLCHHNYREGRNWHESNFCKKSSEDWLKTG